MNRKTMLLSLLALAVPALAGAVGAEEPAAQPDPAQPAVAAAAVTAETEAVSATTEETPAAAEPALPALALGQRVSIDPASGKIVPPRPGEKRAVDARTRAMLSRSSSGLLEIPSPRSGVMVDLLGRFRSATVIEFGAGSEPAAACVTTLEDASDVAAAAEAKEVGHD